MLPLKDDNPRYSRPIVNYILIGLNIFIFLYETSLGPDLRAFIYKYGIIPFEYTRFKDIGIPSAIPINIFTSMFLHGGFFHLAGNMLYLWIFGDNVEDRMGHLWYLIFYLLSGIAAAVAQIVINPSSTVPMIGASGAISGVLGAYVYLFPRARVYTLIPNPFLFGIFYSIIALPAFLLLGFWFVYQLFLGIASLPFSSGGGVAFFAHIGGFVFGFILVRKFVRRVRPPFFY